MPLVRVKTKGQITLPKQIRDELDLSEGDMVEIDIENGCAVIMPRRVVAAIPTPKLSAKEQQALTRAQKKVTAINENMIASKGLTQDEANAAAKVGLIDPDQKYWWLEEWQKGEREAEQDIKDGRLSDPFDTAEGLIAHLQKQTV
jgi:AbrB family looped-hinge helix DNA binding protein